MPILGLYGPSFLESSGISWNIIRLYNTLPRLIIPVYTVPRNLLNSINRFQLANLSKKFTYL